MRNSWLLIKNYFNCFLGGFLRKRKEAKYISAILLLGVISFLIVMMFASTAITTTKGFLEIAKESPGAERLAMFSNCVMALAMMLFLTVMRSVRVNKSNDMNIIAALPVKKSEIIFAKSAYNFIFDFSTLALISLPSFIVYAVLVPGAGIAIVLRGIVVVIMLTMLCGALSALINYLFNKLASVFKYYNIVQTILSLVLVAGFLYINYSLPSLLENYDGTINEMMNNIYPIRLLMSYILDGIPSAILIITICSVIPFILVIFIRTTIYGKESRNYVNKNKVLSFSNKSTLKSLYQKELKRYITTPIYTLNTIIGGIMGIGFSVALVIFGIDTVLPLGQVFPNMAGINSGALVVIINTLLFSTLVTTGTSISLEGKQFWILKAHPVSERDIFKAKLWLNISVSAVCIAIGLPFSIIATKGEYWAMLIVLPFLANIISAILGLYLNLLFPKMEWDNEEEVVKRSLSSGLSIFVGPLVVIIPFIVYFTLLNNLLNFAIFALILAAIFLLLIGLLLKLLFSKGALLFRKI